MRSNEQLELIATGVASARVDEQVRRRIQVAAEMDSIEVERVVVGQITGLRSDPMLFDLRLDGRSLQGKYRDPETHDDLRAFLGFGDRAPLAALSVVAREDLAGTLLDVIDVVQIEAALPESWRRRIAQLGRLKAGWLDGGAAAPSRQALDRAEDLLLACVDEAIDRPGIYPVMEGGVRLEWRTTGGGVELDLPNAGGYELFWYGRDSGTEGGRSFDEDGRDDLLDVLAIYDELSASRPDPCPRGHSYIDLRGQSKNAARRLAGSLRDLAFPRGRQYPD